MRDRPEEGEKLELVRGSGNVFRDLGRESADLEQLKAHLAAERSRRRTIWCWALWVAPLAATAKFLGHVDLPFERKHGCGAFFGEGGRSFNMAPAANSRSHSRMNSARACGFFWPRI
jgi:hypothetical protein